MGRAERHALGNARRADNDGTRRPQPKSRTRKGMSASKNFFLTIALSIYAVFWIALAIHPLDRSDWLLENLLIFISVTVLVVTHGKFEFSNFSYALILIFWLFTPSARITPTRRFPLVFGYRIGCT